MIGVTTDIKENEESYKLLFYSHPLPMWTYDLDSLLFLEVNDAAIQHYGYSREEFLSMSIKEIRPKKEIPKLLQVVEKKRKIWNDDPGIWQHLKKSGEIIWVQIKGQLIEKKGQNVSIIAVIDITEKIKAEEQLLQSEKQYRFLFKNNPLPSWIYDVNTLEFLEVNKAAVRFYGYSKDEFLTMKLTDLHPQNELELPHKRLADEKAQKETTAEKWQHKKKNGDICLVDLWGNLLRYNNREARLIVIDDVTDKAKVEKELEEINERFSLAVKATSDAIYDWDCVLNVITWGDGVQKLFGYQSQEVSISVWEKLIHKEERRKISRSLTQAIEDPKKAYWKAEYRFKKKDDSYSYILDRGFIVRDAQGKPLRMIGAMQDITDIKVKEQQLVQSNERFDIAMKATHDLIWDWNLETGTLYRAKEGLEDVYGVIDERTIQNIYFWLQRIHPDDQEHVQKVIDKILRANCEELFEVEYRFQRDDGTYSNVYDRGKVLCDEWGKPSRMIGAAQDITQRKKLEQQLLQTELEKQKMISKAIIETQEWERSEIGKELHDNVNQILTTTKLYLELSLANPELKDELIQKSAKNIMFVINEIRQLSQSLRDPSIGDLGLVDSIKNLIENINVTRKLHVSMATSDNVEAGLSEHHKLMIFRTIQEALNNAVKHAKATTVLLTLRRDTESLRLKIIDDGVGFDPTLVKKGAGLNNIENRVYLANGVLTIKTAPDKGCKLSIAIPINNSNHSV